MLLARPVRAQQGDPAAARPLFEEGRALMKAGRYEQACPKIEAAAMLYAGSGILLNVADCHEHFGLTATAWRDFGAAAAAAARLHRPDDEAEARRRRKALEPRLRRLTIRVLKETPGLVVKLDGTVVDRADWGTPLPVDPGSHTVGAESAGRFAWSNATEAIDAGSTLVVDVPELGLSSATPMGEPLAHDAQGSVVPSHGADAASAGSDNAPSAPSGASTPPPRVPGVEHAAEASGYWTARRILGVLITGAGIASAGIGGVLGLSAKSQYDKATGEAGPPRHDDSVSAVNTGNLATIVLAVGGATAVAGGILWITAPDRNVTLGTSGQALVLRGVF
jgi:hypothetical protein